MEHVLLNCPNYTQLDLNFVLGLIVAGDSVISTLSHENRITYQLYYQQELYVTGGHYPQFVDGKREVSGE